MTEALLGDFESQITDITLMPSDGGRFEVTVDGELIYSKKSTKRTSGIDPAQLLFVR